MKNKISLCLICIITLLCLSGCGSRGVSGKYETIDDITLELYDNGECYYEDGNIKYNDCSYNVSSDNQVRLEYSDYNVIYERDETYHQEFDILENGNLKNQYGEILYKK